jgi:hypothetical protein
MAHNEDSADVEALRDENARLRAFVNAARLFPEVMEAMAVVTEHIQMDTPDGESLKEKHVAWIREHAQVWRDNLAVIDSQVDSFDPAMSDQGFIFTVFFKDGARYSWNESSNDSEEWIDTGDWTSPFPNTAEDSFAFGMMESWSQDSEGPIYPLFLKHGDVTRLVVRSAAGAQDSSSQEPIVAPPLD